MPLSHLKVIQVLLPDRFVVVNMELIVPVIGQPPSDFALVRRDTGDQEVWVSGT